MLERARRGEREGLAELWRAFQAPLLRYLTTKRMQSPEDVASRVWIDVASSIDRFEGDEDDKGTALYDEKTDRYRIIQLECP